MPKVFLLLLPLFAGCAVGGMQPVTPDHPASPAAVEAPLRERSDTLALPSSEEAAAADRGRKASAAGTPSGGGGHAHH